MDCKYFNPEVNYDRTLERLKASLLKRWQNDEPSPHTNLQNFEEQLQNPIKKIKKTLA